METLFFILMLAVIIFLVFVGYSSGNIVLLSGGGVMLMLLGLSVLWTGFDRTSQVETVGNFSFSNGNVIETNSFQQVKDNFTNAEGLVLVIFGVGLLAEVAAMQELTKREQNDD